MVPRQSHSQSTKSRRPMQSLRSRFFLWLIRNRHLLSFKLKPEVVDDTFSVAEFREGVDRVTARMKMPKGVEVSEAHIDGMYAEWIVPEAAPSDKALMYIHGGGFISGSCNTHRMHVAKFALGSGLRSLLFDYRLAPEHPFPAALEDCLSAYAWMLEQGYEPRNIVVGGESAGGTLTLSLLLALEERGLPQPAAAFSISPVTDLRCQADSFTYNAKRDIAPYGSWTVWTRYYIGEHDPADALLSPLMGNYAAVPPLLICVGSFEIHLDDCVNLSKKAEKDGADVTLSVWPKMVHAFPIMSPLFPEARRALDEICGFARHHAGE